MFLDVDKAANAIYDAQHPCILNVPEVSYVKSKFPKWFFKNLKHIILSKKRTHAKFKTVPLIMWNYLHFKLLTRQNIRNFVLPSCLVLSIC